jgi:hypothetical protein
MIFKSTYEILNCPWEEKEDMLVFKIPPKWDNNAEMSFNDVVIWEQIYHQPGSIGIYIAWSPQSEFYAVVYDLFSKTEAGVKIFRGPDAITQVTTLAAELGIQLTTTRISV